MVKTPGEPAGPERHDVVVVGAGISGLAAATFLDDGQRDVRVLEAGEQAGGNVRTEVHGPYTVDRAANGWLDNEPAMGRLLARVGLEEAQVRASDAYGTRWIWSEGALHPVPMGPGKLLRSRLLSWPGKVRLLGELLVPQRTDGAEETVAEFVERRLGTEGVDKLVGPMVAGIHAADPTQVSLPAAFPRMVELEREHGGLFRAMFALRRGGAPRGHLATLPGGAGAVTTALAESLGDRLQTGRAVRHLERRSWGWRLHTDAGPVDTVAVVLACPADAQAGLLEEHAPDAASGLRQIPYAPISVVVTAWRLDELERPPEGFGVLLARGEPEGWGGVLGTVFSSRVFPDQAPEGEVLLRTMVGGGVLPEAALADEQALMGGVRRHLEALMGPLPEARFQHILRHRHGIPGYRPGHPERVRQIRASVARVPGLFVTGNHLEGIGVKDCARAGEAVADEVSRVLDYRRSSAARLP